MDVPELLQQSTGGEWMAQQGIGKCPQCKHVYCLVYTGRENKRGDHVYKCIRPVCGATVGSPTTYGECAIKGRIWKDTFYNPCATCTDKRLQQLHGHNICKHWKGLVYMDTV